MIIYLLLLIIYYSFIMISAQSFAIDTLMHGWINLSIYIISTVLFLKKYRRTMINPELFIFIVFLLCTFLYLPLLYNSDVSGFVFNQLHNETAYNLIKAQSIALISIFLYMLGSILVEVKNKREKIVCVSNKNSVLVKNRRIFHVLTFLLIVISMMQGGYKIIYRYTEKTIGLDEIGGLFSYITIFLVISSILEFMYQKDRHITSFFQLVVSLNHLYLVNILFMTFLYLFAGYRSAVFPIILPLLFLYDLYIKKINKTVLIIYIIIGIIFMSMIKDSRSGNYEISTKDVFKLDYIAGDFISANKGLFLLIEHTDAKGSQYGKNALLPMVSFIPFAQSTLINVFGFEQSDSSSRFFTDEVGSYWSGLGTHVIGDLYYSFGMFGVFFCMFILGAFTNMLYIKVVRLGSVNIYHITLLLLILGNSIMFSRVEFFYLIRNIGFSIIILWIFGKTLSNK